MSELLKQNIGGKILRQTYGGKILKANFNFGKGIDLTYTNPDRYITIPNLVGTELNKVSLETFTWWRFNLITGVLACDFSSEKLKFGSNPTLYTSIYSGYSTNDLIAQTYSGPEIADVMKNIIYISDLENGNHKVRAYNPDFSTSVSQATGSFIYNDRIITDLRLLKSWNKTAYIRIYNRIVTDAEHDFAYNKSLGNNPMSTLDLIVYYDFTNAEIIDFGGAINEAVGIVDISGNNNHGQIVGLPAGTVQEQLDYANANLFSNFL